MAKLGQHFMIDKQVLGCVVDSAQLEPDERVLEIGPGEGALTELLLKRCSVTAIEKDPAFAGLLNRKFPGLKLINADAIKVSWPQFDKCVSNLPYLISKKFLLKLLRHDFKLAVLVLQREFAEKLAAKTGDRAYGVVSVCAQACCDVELLDRIPRNAFRPQPRVESQIVRLSKRTTLDEGFIKFVTTTLQNRNKKMGDKRVRDLSPDELLQIYNGNGV
jgi:16S rRNA (adenine1518-N6/adenine1519-N6)-dimethyltransferase